MIAKPTGALALASILSLVSTLALAQTNKPAQSFTIDKGPSGTVNVDTSFGSTGNTPTINSIGVSGTSGSHSGGVFATPSGQLGVSAGKSGFSGTVETGPQGNSGSVGFTTTFK